MEIKHLGKSGNALIFAFIINSVVDLFVYTFFTAYLLTLSNNDIALIAQFYMIEYLFLGAMFFVFVSVAKKIKHVNMLRIGAVAKGLFILLVVLLGQGIVGNCFWLGALCGTFEAIFWTGANTLKNLVVQSDKIKGLVSITSINTQIIGIVCPVVFGISIDAMSFIKISIIVLGLIICEIISTLFVKQIKVVDKKSNFKQFFHILKTEEKARNIVGANKMMFFRGLQYFIPIFITYMIVYVLKTNTSLGALTTLAAIFAILLLVAFNVIKNADKNIWSYIIFTVLECISLLLCVIFMQPVFIIIFQVVYTSIKCTVEAMSEALRGTTVRDANLDDYMTESIAVGEFYLNSGRVIGFFVLFIMGLASSLVVSILLSCIVMTFLVLYNVSTGRLKSKIKKDALKMQETTSVASEEVTSDNVKSEESVNE